ncbi:MAG: hypothetical protein KC656_18350, partial [Myxococcales bacterium]|nr:hypothetical protein [Myxococcales bacterium]
MPHWTDDWPALAVLSTCEAREVQLPEGTGVEYVGLPARVLGGAPGVGENPDLDVLGWEPPPWLTRLYGVHGGLGPWWPTGAGAPD